MCFSTQSELGTKGVGSKTLTCRLRCTVSGALELLYRPRHAVPDLYLDFRHAVSGVSEVRSTVSGGDFLPS